MFVVKNLDKKPCRCCGEIFPYWTKDHVPVKFPDADKKYYSDDSIEDR